MAFSLKKRSRSKSQMLSVNTEQSKSLGEVLHRSTKTKTKDKSLLCPPAIIPSPDTDLELASRPPTSEKTIAFRTRCLCETHHEKELIACNYRLAVDKLFDLLFGSNEFVQTYREAQRFYDDTATEWTRNESTSHRERILTYKVPYESTFVGKGTICTREKQILFHEILGSHYMLETEVSNTGVKFSDTFSLIIRYCLVQTSFTTTNLRVTAQVVYHKSVNGIIKQLIERNAYSASQEGLKDLNNRLNLISDFKMEQRRLSRSEITLSVPRPPEIVRRMSQPKILPVPQTLPVHNTRPAHSDNVMYIVIFLLGFLLLMHLYLCVKLKRMAVMVDDFVQLSKL